MLRRLGDHGITMILFAVGGHTVLEKLLAHQTRAAIFQALGVATCVLIFLVLHKIVGSASEDAE